MTSTIDDQTAAYVAATHTFFEDLKQVAAQLAGFLVLHAAGSESANPDHPLLKSAHQVFQRAEDGIRAVQVSRGAHDHHTHLLNAATLLDEVLSSLRRRGDPLVLLEQTWAELRAASRALPGFPILDFERGCCGSPQAVRCGR
jgi:hypothetical protein